MVSQNCEHLLSKYKLTNAAFFEQRNDSPCPFKCRLFVIGKSRIALDRHSARNFVENGMANGDKEVVRSHLQFIRRRRVFGVVGGGFNVFLVARLLHHG